MLGALEDRSAGLPPSVGCVRGRPGGRLVPNGRVRRLLDGSDGAGRLSREGHI